MKINQEMRKRGYKMSLSGSRYMQEAARMIAKQPETKRMYMTKEVYPTIAKAANVDWRSVEHAMRYATRAAQPGRTVSQEIYDIAMVARAYED